MWTTHCRGKRNALASLRVSTGFEMAASHQGAIRIANDSLVADPCLPIFVTSKKREWPSIREPRKNGHAAAQVESSVRTRWRKVCRCVLCATIDSQVMYRHPTVFIQSKETFIPHRKRAPGECRIRGAIDLRTGVIVRLLMRSPAIRPDARLVKLVSVGRGSLQDDEAGCSIVGGKRQLFAVERLHAVRRLDP